MKKIHKERLRELHKMLKNHEKLFKGVVFDLTSWANEKDGLQDEDFAKAEKTKKYIDCASSACALGSAGLHKPFIAQGLVTTMHGYDDASVCYDQETSFEAGAKFFGLTLTESKWLFDPNAYRFNPQVPFNEPKAKKFITHKAVATRVLHLIKHYEIKASKFPLMRDTSYGDAQDDYEYWPADYVSMGMVR